MAKLMQGTGSIQDDVQRLIELYEQGALKEASGFCDTLLNQHANIPLLWNIRGIFFRDTGALEQAEHAYRKAIELDPNFAAPYNNLGLVMADKGQFEDAVRLS